MPFTNEEAPPLPTNTTVMTDDAKAARHSKNMERRLRRAEGKLKFLETRTTGLETKVGVLMNLVVTTPELQQEYKGKMQQASAETKGQKEDMTRICSLCERTLKELEGTPATKESVAILQQVVNEAGNLQHRLILAAKKELERRKNSLNPDFREDIPKPVGNSTAPTREDFTKGAEAAEARVKANRSTLNTDD